jgi:hypothetical protein
MFLERVVAALTPQQKAAALTTWLPAVHTTLLELYLTPPLPQLAQLQLGDPTAQPPTSTSQVRVFPHPVTGPLVICIVMAIEQPVWAKY